MPKKSRTVVVILKKWTNDPLEGISSPRMQEAEAPQIDRARHNSVSLCQVAEGRAEGERARLRADEVGRISCTNGIDPKGVFWSVGQKGGPDVASALGWRNPVFGEGA